MNGNRSLKVAMIGFRGLGRALGGVETHVENLAPRLAGLGCEVTLFCRRAYEPRQGAVAPGLTIRHAPALPGKHLETATYALAASWSCLRGFDVVHYHGVGPCLFSWLPRLAGRAVAATVHSLDHRHAKWGPAARAALSVGTWCAARLPRATIVVSSLLEDHFRNHYGTRTHLIPNGVAAPGPVPPLEKLRSLGIHAPGFVLFLGRLTPEKDLPTLISAYKTLDTDKALVIAGAEGPGSGLDRTLRGLAGDDARIIFTGPVTGRTKEEALAHAGLMVLPSLTEGMPIVILEAAAHGLPVLASDIPECLDVLAGAATDQGVPDPPLLTFAAGDRKSLATSLGKALAAPPGELEAMALAARDFVLAQYDWDDLAKKTMQIYVSLLDEKPRAG